VVARANAKALGLLADNGAVDGIITFNSKYSFDYNPSNGVSGYDFVGVATHEILTVLGFFSGVDTVDLYRRYGIGTESMAVTSVLDLFRYSSKSLAKGAGVIDMAAGDADYFSTDGGATNSGNFGTGAYFGDHYQASRFKVGSGGVMQATAPSGRSIPLVGKDLLALDAIGWDLTGNGQGVVAANGVGAVATFSDPRFFETPEPATLSLFGIAVGALGLFKRRRRKT
jgi:hypothetical protein